MRHLSLSEFHKLMLESEIFEHEPYHQYIYFYSCYSLKSYDVSKYRFYLFRNTSGLLSWKYYTFINYNIDCNFEFVFNNCHEEVKEKLIFYVDLFL